MQQGWHPSDIRAAVEKAGKSLSQCALDVGLNGAACRIATRHRHEGGERAIADLIGVPLFVLWPDRWEEQAGHAVRIDNRFTRHRSQRSEDSRRMSIGHGQKRKAA